MLTISRVSVLLTSLAALALTTDGHGPPPPARDDASAAQVQGASQPIPVIVHEGTSMAVTVSPDGATLAMDLQGGLWTLPATGGTARRITDEFNDARQPAWSPDGRWIAFQGYRAGGYDIWAVAPDGSGQHQLTNGPYDDREPAWSHDGTRLAFSSDRGDGGNYNIWTLDLRTGALQQVTRNPADDFMPSWSPDDREIAFISTRESPQSAWAIRLADGAERKVSAPGERADAPSWGPAGIVYEVLTSQSSQLVLDGKALTGDENAFPFRATWVAPNEIVYTSDGKIRRRTIGAASARTIEFTATLDVRRAEYTPRVRDVDSRAPRKALGVVGPVISPDGRQVAFVALGDLWLMPVGGTPQNLTHDRFLDDEPAWSPDGSQLAWATDRGGTLLDLWVRDMKTGAERQLTHLSSSTMGPAWSPDGKRIAFLEVDGVWRRASVSVVDVATGKVTKIHQSMFGPGNPTWSPDGRRVAITAVHPFSARFREGTNQVLTIAADGSGAEEWHEPVRNLSIDSRVGMGPAWSPDGTRMAIVYEGMLTLLSVRADGTPLGPPRRVTNEMAFDPSWTADSKHILYQSMDHLRLLDVETGATHEVPLDLSYTPFVPTDRFLIHAGTLVDMTSPTPRHDVDILVEGNRIRSVAPHSAAAHAGVRVIDASGLTVMPGLIEYHSHLQKDLGESSMRAWLAFGITTLRSPGSTPYEAVEDREAVDAGVRAGPRVYGTGYLLEWKRTYYKMGEAISSTAHLELELQREKALQLDMIKSYVRMPDLQQKRIVEFAHSIGIPVSSHEIYPAAEDGIDGMEHTAATSRRGYSPKMATLSRSYSDVTSVLGAARMTFTPTLALGGASLRRMMAADSTIRSDPRFALYPEWLSGSITGNGGRGARGGRGAGRGGRGGRGGAGGRSALPVGVVGLAGSGANKMIMDALHAGARVVAGTDTPDAMNLHAEVQAYVDAGMTRFEALRTATVTPSAALGLDAGTVQAGKIADLLVVEGNPLEDLNAMHHIRHVIANGRLYEPAELLKGVDPKAAPGATGG